MALRIGCVPLTTTICVVTHDCLKKLFFLGTAQQHLQRQHVHGHAYQRSVHLTAIGSDCAARQGTYCGHTVDILNRCNALSVESQLQGKRLKWLGHVFRMPNDRLPKKLLFGEVKGLRPPGRPRSSFNDVA